MHARIYAYVGMYSGGGCLPVGEVSLDVLLRFAFLQCVYIPSLGSILEGVKLI